MKTSATVKKRDTQQDSGKLLKVALTALPLLLVGIQWLADGVRPNNLLLEVPKVQLLPWLETP